MDTKKEMEKISNILKLKMSTGNNRKIQSVCYTNHGDSFNKRQLIEKLKGLKLDHFVDESTYPQTNFNITSQEEHMRKIKNNKDKIVGTL